MEFVNRICPNCKNPNYMVLLGDFSKAYKYKCMNCNRYFDDVDLDYYNNQAYLQTVWKSECMNTKVDMVEVVRCKDCRYGQYCTDGETTYQCFKWNSNEFGALHEQDWFCADGKRK